MDEIDKAINDDFLTDDERMLHSDVICGEADLFYLDCFLSEMLRPSEL
ncbi:MAG: hypothetical protein J6K90_05995 [Tidjanibacter sp.]|nr:hypothetical protein [Tidjanibacter sp.]